MHLRPDQQGQSLGGLSADDCPPFKTPLKYPPYLGKGIQILRPMDAVRSEIETSGGFSKREALFIGGVIRGGIEGIQMMPERMTRKLRNSFHTLGAAFILVSVLFADCG